MIRSGKSVLQKSLGQALIVRVQLERILQVIEPCVNSRPLTYFGNTEQPLTPSHFLIGRSSALNLVMVCEHCEQMLNLELTEKCQS